MNRRSPWRKASGPFLLPLVVLGLFGLAVIAALVVFVFVSTQPAPPASDPAVAEAESEPLAVQQFQTSGDPLDDRLRLHRMRCGLQDVSSLSLNGSYRSGGQAFDLSLVARKPNLVRQLLRLESGGRGAFTAVFNGEDEWLELTSPGGEPEVREIDAVNSRVLKLEGNYAALAWTFEQRGDNGLAVVGEEPVGAETCLVIENRNLLAEPVRHFVGADGYEWRRETTAVIDGSERQLAIAFGEPVEDDGRLRPSSYRVMIDGEEVCVAVIDSLRTNIGVFPAVFERPE